MGKVSKRRNIALDTRASGRYWGGPVVTAEEIRRYRRVPTERKLQWLEDMRRLMFATMTPELRHRWEEMRKRGY